MLDFPERQKPTIRKVETFGGDWFLCALTDAEYELWCTYVKAYKDIMAFGRRHSGQSNISAYPTDDDCYSKSIEPEHPSQLSQNKETS